MNTKQILPWWPTSRLLLLAVFAITMAFSFALSLTTMQGEYFLWSRTNRIIHDSLWISGSVLAGFSAVLAIMIWPQQSILTPRTTEKDPASAVIHQVGAIILASATGHIVGLLPLLYSTTQNAQGGYLSWASLLVAFSGIVTLTSIGFFTGLAVRKYFIAPLIAVLCFAFMGIINSPIFRPLALFFPVHQVSGSARFETNPAVALFSFIFACLVIISGASLFRLFTAQLPARLPAGRILTTAISRYVPAACTIFLIALGFAWRPELLTVHYPVNTSCFTADNIKFCLHEQNLPASASVESATKNLQYAGITPLLATVNDDAAVDYDAPTENEALVIVDPGPYGGYEAVSSVEESLAWQAVSSVITDRCHSATFEAHNVNMAIAFEMLTRSNYERLAQYLSSASNATLRAMTDAEFIQFIAANSQRITSCTMENITP
ncbi:MAG: hypothetical protein Q4E03_02755 [Trueperella sp.]|nr:hypothetical protein [Trueperella sp.]